MHEITECRSCGSLELISIFNMGTIHNSDFVNTPEELSLAFPVELVLCGDCQLLQLKHTLDPDALYRQYWYKSGINEMIIKDLEDIIRHAEALVPLKGGDVVVDIGANDGTLLRFYREGNLVRAGFEPAKNLIDEAEQGNTVIFNDYFSADILTHWPGYKKAKIVTSIAMFYDLDYPNLFVEDVRSILDKKGVWIIEMRYLPSMFEQNDIGNICFEHLEYYTLHSLKTLIDRHGLEIFDISFNKINGGSIRVYIRHKGGERLDGAEGFMRVDATLEREKLAGYLTQVPYQEFAKRAETIKKQIRKALDDFHKMGLVVHAYGASTKGNTLLQYWGVDVNDLEAAAERDTRKHGKFMVWSKIPIWSEETSRKRAQVYFVLIWHFREGILDREQQFLKHGGKFLFPLPEPTLVEYNGVSRGIPK